MGSPGCRLPEPDVSRMCLNRVIEAGAIAHRRRTTEARGSPRGARREAAGKEGRRRAPSPKTASSPVGFVVVADGGGAVSVGGGSEVPGLRSPGSSASPAGDIVVPGEGALAMGRSSGPEEFVCEADSCAPGELQESPPRYRAAAAGGSSAPKIFQLFVAAQPFANLARHLPAFHSAPCPRACKKIGKFSLQWSERRRNGVVEDKDAPTILRHSHEGGNLVWRLRNITASESCMRRL